jgi:hypothetical protein
MLCYLHRNRLQNFLHLGVTASSQMEPLVLLQALVIAVGYFFASTDNFKFSDCVAILTFSIVVA